MRTYSTLELGNPTDANTWEVGCNRKGLKAISSIKANSPSMEKLIDFFNGQPDWVYLSGHFANLTLWGEGDTEIEFKKDRVIILKGSHSKDLTKSESGFRMHESCLLVVWGGCGALGEKSSIKTIRELFLNPAILGYSGSTGWAINNSMLGGGFIRNHFFSQIKDTSSSDDLVDAWMDCARRGYGGGPNEWKFRAVDSDGQEWMLSDSKIKKGRKF